MTTKKPRSESGGLCCLGRTNGIWTVARAALQEMVYHCWHCRRFKSARTYFRCDCDWIFNDHFSQIYC